MKKMLQVLPVAIFFFMMSVPGYLTAQTLTQNPGGFSLSGPMLIIASVIVVFKVTLALSIFINKKRGGSH